MKTIKNFAILKLICNVKKSTLQTVYDTMLQSCNLLLNIYKNKYLEKFFDKRTLQLFTVKLTLLVAFSSTLQHCNISSKTSAMLKNLKFLGMGWIDRFFPQIIPVCPPFLLKRKI